MLVLALLLISLAFFGSIYCFSRPVLLVSDNVFDALYGSRRALYKKASFFFRFFRPVKTVSLAVGSGADLVEAAIQAVSKEPYMVFFPYRYLAAAERYLQAAPGIPSVILGGREKPHGNGGLVWFSTDIMTDLYRAGSSAGALIQDTGAEGELVVFHNGLTDEEQTVFIQGLADTNSGARDSVRFAGSGWESSGEQIACAVITGEIGALFDTREDSPAGAIPLLIFSWLDPALLPDETALVFDDSPWEILSEVFQRLEKGQTEETIPSNVSRGRKSRSAGLMAENFERTRSLRPFPRPVQAE